MRVRALALLLTSHATLRCRIRSQTFISHRVAAIDTDAEDFPLHALARGIDVAQFDDVAVDKRGIDIDQCVCQRIVGGIRHRARQITMMLRIGRGKLFPDLRRQKSRARRHA